VGVVPPAWQQHRYPGKLGILPRTDVARIEGYRLPEARRDGRDEGAARIATECRTECRTEARTERPTAYVRNRCGVQRCRSKVVSTSVQREKEDSSVGGYIG